MNYRAAGPTSSTPPPARVIDRLFSRWTEDSKGCWVSGYSTGNHGYSQIGWTDSNGRYLWLGHRVSWYAYNGAIPTGYTVDHLCRNRRCIRPDHLRLLSNWENARRNGWAGSDDYPQSWACSRNHEVPRRKYDGACPECHRENNARYRERRRLRETGLPR